MTGSPPNLRLTLAPTVDAAARVRHALKALAGDRFLPSILDDVVLVASELVTNAALYSNDAVTVSAWCSAHSGWRVEVDDASVTIPRVGVEGVGADRVGGWGLRIVDPLATRWGVHPLASGKRCWFEITP